MSTGENHIKQYSAEDIQRYINRQMSPAEMHALEKASLDDPFLAEAMEGYFNTGITTVPSDIAALKEKLSPQPDNKVVPLYGKNDRNKKIWWSAAAVILVLLGTSATWWLLSNNAENNIAQQKEKSLPQPPAQVESADKETNAAGNADTAVLPLPKTAKSEAVQLENKLQEKATASAPVVSDEESSRIVQRDSTRFDLKDKVDGLQTDKSVSVSNADQADDIGKKQEAETLQKAKVSAPVTPEVARKKGNAEAFLSSNIFKGKVTDEQNKPLPFANLNISNSSMNTYTDVHGNFRFMSGDAEALVNVKSVGYESTQFNVQSNIASNNIILKTDPKHLREIVIAGYGSQKKRNFAKQEDKKENEVEKEDDRAEPVDGWDFYDIYLYNNKRIPDSQINSSGGYADISFYVDKYGNLFDFHIEHSACVACDKEATRLIKQGPRWKLIKGTTPEKVILTVQF